MSKAIKCNRCDKCFDPLEIDGVMCRFSNPKILSAHDIREGVAKYLFPFGPDGWVDLCPDCTEAFEAFMNNAENAEQILDKRLGMKGGLVDLLDLFRGSDFDGDKD